MTDNEEAPSSFRVERAKIDERTLREKGKGIPKSYAEYLDETYGPEGTGWAFCTDAYDSENGMNRELHKPEFDLANEALINSLQPGGKYTLDDGTSARGLAARPVDPDLGDVIVFPEGEEYHQHLLDSE